MPDDWTFSDLVPGRCGLTPFSPRGFIRDRRSKQEYESNSMQENVHPMCSSSLCSRVVLCPRTRKRASHAAFRVLPVLAISDRKMVLTEKKSVRIEIVADCKMIERFDSVWSQYRSARIVFLCS